MIPDDEHCVHCGDNCGDDHRARNGWPQTLHTDEAGTFWRPWCCPYCRVARTP